MPINGHTLCVLIWSHPSPMSHGVSSVKQRSRGTNREVVFGLSLVRPGSPGFAYPLVRWVLSVRSYFLPRIRPAQMKWREFLGAKNLLSRVEASAGGPVAT